MGLPKALVSWSTGKDSAYALLETRRTAEVEVVGLLTTVTAGLGRVSMHGVRDTLLDRQIEELALPCAKIAIPSPCPNDVYEREMRRVLSDARDRGVTHVVFGDLFLRDIREYREARPQQLAPAWAGRAFDDALLDELPPEVDPCGENGEFHTFVTAGPMFHHPIAVRAGEVVTRDGFVYANLLPA